MVSSATREARHPNCPHCGHDESYIITTRDKFRCKGCLRQFSAKSASPYRDSKLPLSRIAAIREQMAGMERLNIARIARDHGLSYRGAYGIVKKIKQIEAENP